MRRAVLLFVLACGSSEPAQPDPAVGLYHPARGDDIELRADGTVVCPPIMMEDRCVTEKGTAFIEACGKKQRWHHSGNRIQIDRAHVAPKQRVGLGMNYQDMPCDCFLDPFDATVEGDTLISGNERATRVRR